MQRIWYLLILLIANSYSYGQDCDTKILNSILTKYYESEKVVIKNRIQFLFLFCGKPADNEQILETVNEMKLPAATISAIRKEIASDTKIESWESNLETLYAFETFQLKNKINSCLSLEQYQSERAKRNLNNQRLMIISKPILYSDGNHALVKVVFYRTIEHNNGSVLHLEKINNEWIIREYLNSWST